MRILIQRVFQAWVRVEGVQISRTGNGLIVLVGMTHNDNTDVADHMVSKILNMRLWEKEGKTWNGSVMDVSGDIMVVSQFTLYSILKGNKPDFHSSMNAEQARELFNYTVDQLRKKYVPERIKTGKFQALMQVGSVINGPVTIQYQKHAQDVAKMGKQKKQPAQKIEMTKKPSQKNKKKVEQKQKMQEPEKKIPQNPPSETADKDEKTQ